jgi:hypothetical protein
MKNSFPSDVQSYLSEIAERLWTSHASIMIGAGFSKNAINTINPTKQPPNWWQLGDIFYEKLYKKKPENEIKYASLLKLAEEFEVAFGRPALEHFIAKNIADNEYEPSILHQRLMELPWTDVFTTNYDTLLERSCKDVISRRYDIVVNKNDLVYSNKPRIIKLHGSLPSERPFIITEEDYRNYPRQFAPFVNTVQQSLLENTLCLLGFSGDDPNFLQWLGWINDNIGKNNAPKIYLVGVLNLSESQKKLLNNKNIIVVDLSPCNQINGDHGKGLEVFIEYLASQRQKRENLNWPLSSDLKNLKSTGENVNYGLLIDDWQVCRKKYPNWVILPQEQRDKLWAYTEHHSYNISVFEHLNEFDDLKYIYELNWRLEKCLFPIWNDMVPYFQKVLDQYNFFPQEISESREINLDEKKNDIEWPKYRNYWVQLTLSLLRFYREENFDEKWNETHNIINSVEQKLSADQLSQFYFEQVLRTLFKLKHNEAKKLLDEWPQNNTSVFWSSKRAMLLSEFGQLTEAVNILESCLLEIRKKLNLSPIEDDYTWVSLESYVMLQLRMVQDNIRWSKKVYEESSDTKHEEYNERWNDLLQYKCDPWGEQRYFDLMLQQRYSPKNSTSINNEFEIGKSTRSFTVGGVSKDFVVAYTFLRYIEELSIPLSLSSVNLSVKTISGLLERIRFVSPQWGIAILNRSREEKIIDIVFGREQMLKLSYSMIDSYIEEYIKLFYELLPERKTNPIAKAFINKVPYILSRLCTKCSDSSKLDIYKLYLQLNIQELNLSKSEKLISNLVNSSSDEVLHKAAEILLDVPLLNPERAISYALKEPFDFIQPNKIKINNKVKNEIFDFLIDKVTKNDGFRENAIKRLFFLYESNQLNKLQTKKVFTTIWDHIDEESGFPKKTSFFHFAFIKWYQPTGINAEEMYKKYIIENNFNIQGLLIEAGIGMSGGGDRYAEELLYGSQSINNEIGVIWNDDELNSILIKCKKWWELDKKYLVEEKYRTEGFGGSVYEEFTLRFTKLTNIIARVLGIRKNDLHKTVITDIKSITDEMEALGVSVLKIKVVFGFYNHYEDYLEELKSKLISNNRKVLLDALDSVILAVHDSPYKNNSSFISRLLDILLIPLQWRIFDLMGDILDVFKDFIKHSELDITSKKNEIYDSLQYILDIPIKEENITIDDFLLLKQKSISLAGIMFRQCVDNKIDIPQTLLNWKAVSGDIEEFGDIRNRW